MNWLVMFGVAAGLWAITPLRQNRGVSHIDKILIAIAAVLLGLASG
jgi:hypothetical protein